MENISFQHAYLRTLILGLQTYKKIRQSWFLNQNARPFYKHKQVIKF